MQDPGEKGFHSFRCLLQSCQEILGLSLQGFIAIFPNTGILPGGFQFLLQVCNHSGSGDGFLRQIAALLLLPKTLERVLYLDVDLVVINSLEELYHTDFEGNYYVACSHVKEILTKINQLRLGVEDVVPYINTGVMVMNLTALRDHLTIEQIRETARKKMHIFLLPDQDLLTVMHGERIKLVDTMRYNLSDRLLSYHNANPKNQPLDLKWVRENVVIIHYYGKSKLWKSGYSGVLDAFYHENTE